MAAHRWIFIRPVPAPSLAPILVALAILVAIALVEVALALGPPPPVADAPGVRAPIPASAHPDTTPQALPASQRSPASPWRWM